MKMTRPHCTSLAVRSIFIRNGVKLSHKSKFKTESHIKSTAIERTSINMSKITRRKPYSKFLKIYPVPNLRFGVL